MSQIKKLCSGAICLALCLVFPFLTGQIPEVGNALCPMHIPVLLAGFICGPWWAMGVGFIAPLLRFLLFGMPPIFPTGIAMAFELAAYGLLSGLFYQNSPKKTLHIYVSLIAAMLTGRIIWGIACTILSGASGVSFSWAVFLSGAFTTAIPGIILQIVLIPVLVIALKNAKVIAD